MTIFESIKQICIDEKLEEISKNPEIYRLNANVCIRLNVDNTVDLIFDCYTTQQIKLDYNKEIVLLFLMAYLK